MARSSPFCSRLQCCRVVVACLVASVSAGCIQSSTFTSAESPTTAAALAESFNHNLIDMLYCARSSGTVVVVAHRGGVAPGFPENALNSIERSTQAAPVVVELDVVRSADGVLYLHHDDQLDRTTTGSGPYNALPWSSVVELQLIDNDHVTTEQHPVSLAAALMRLRGSAFVMLDLKDRRATAEAVAMVVDSGLLEATAFIAYDLEQAREILANAPEASLAMGLDNAVAFAETELAPNALIALTGAIERKPDVPERIQSTDLFLLGGSYLSTHPLDAKLATDPVIPAFDLVASAGYQMVVSNRALLAARYLQGQRLLVGQRACD